MSQDQIAIPRNWTFEKAEIAAAFDRHVREQLPWYDLATGAIAHIARHYIPAGGLVYDIGASTGNIGRALSETLKDRRARLVAIEAAAEMVVRYDGPGEVIQADAMAFDFEPFDLGVCFLLLIFLPVSRRAAFVQKLRQRIKARWCPDHFRQMRGGDRLPRHGAVEADARREGFRWGRSCGDRREGTQPRRRPASDRGWPPQR